MAKFLLISAILVCSNTLVACCKQENIPDYINKLNSSNSREVTKAARELANCGSKANKAVTKLSELIYDSNVGVQSAAAYALRKIDTPEARAIMQSAGQKK